MEFDYFRALYNSTFKWCTPFFFFFLLFWVSKLMKRVLFHLNMTRQCCTGSTRRQGLAAVGSLTEFVQTSVEVKRGAKRNRFESKKRKRKERERVILLWVKTRFGCGGSSRWHLFLAHRSGPDSCSAFVYSAANDVFCRNMDSKSNIKLAYV